MQVHVEVDNDVVLKLTVSILNSMHICIEIDISSGLSLTLSILNSMQVDLARPLPIIPAKCTSFEAAALVRRDSETPPNPKQTIA